MGKPVPEFPGTCLSNMIQIPTALASFRQTFHLNVVGYVSRKGWLIEFVVFVTLNQERSRFMGKVDSYTQAKLAFAANDNNKNGNLLFEMKK